MALERRHLAIAAASAVLISGAIIAKRYFSPEAEIRRMFASVAQSIADERLLATAGHLSRSYSDPWGQSYESVLGLAHDVFESYEEPRLSYDLKSISRSGRTATVELGFRLSATVAGRDEALVGSLLEPARAVLELREDGGDWRIERAIELEVPGRPR